MNSDQILSIGLMGGLVMLLSYAWIRYRNVPLSARVEKEGGTRLLGAKCMSVVYHSISPLSDWLAERNVSANAVTWLSLPIGMISGWAAAFGHWSVASLCLLLSGLCDLLDGAIARKRGQVSRSGAILDSTLDRYVEFFVLLGISIHFRESMVVVGVAFCALFGSLMVTYSTAKAEALQMLPPRGFMKRSERMAYLIVGCLVAPLFPLMGLTTQSALLVTVGLIAFFANISAVIRMRAIYKQT